ncbi:unnamed protein product [Symbiodinium natans]|uniref:Uncharacterized protein n=1 Tax=Symbiodinium natans TaxID=878477 RepID=A0A812GEI3_9DINO|nr:unnamed protein product [Symbiodinium natans]
MSQPADEGVVDLFRALKGVSDIYFYWSHEPVVNRAVVRLRQALEQVVGLAIVNVLDEMQSGLADPQVQQVGVSFLKAVVADSKGTTKDLIQRAGVVQVLVQSMTKHPCTENLLTEALAVLDELHGLAALLQALEHLRPSVPGTRAALQTLRLTARKRWHEVERCPAVPLTRVIIDALRAHPTEIQLLILGIQLLGDLAGDLPEVRVAFFQVNGWDWLLQVLESQPSKDSWQDLELQQEGVRLIAQLCKGGASGDIHSRRVGAILEQVLQRSQNDGRVLYWGLWAVQQLHGIGSLLGTLRGNWNADVVKQTLRSLSGVAWGQGEGADSEAENATHVLQSVIETMRNFAADAEVLRESSFVLARTAVFAAQHEVPLGMASWEPMRISFFGALED